MESVQSPASLHPYLLLKGQVLRWKQPRPVAETWKASVRLLRQLEMQTLEKLCAASFAFGHLHSVSLISSRTALHVQSSWVLIILLTSVPLPLAFLSQTFLTGVSAGVSLLAGLPFSGSQLLVNASSVFLSSSFLLKAKTSAESVVTTESLLFSSRHAPESCLLQNCDFTILLLALYKSGCQGVFGLISSVFSGTVEDLQSQSASFRSKAGLSQPTACGAGEQLQSWPPTALFNGVRRPHPGLLLHSIPYLFSKWKSKAKVYSQVLGG